MSTQIIFMKGTTDMSTVKKILVYVFFFTLFIGILVMLGCERSDSWKSMLFWGLVIVVGSGFAIHTMLHTAHVVRHIFAIYTLALVAGYRMGIRNDATDMANELYSEINNPFKFYTYICHRYYAEKLDEELDNYFEF